ncbi:MAG: hypothetical protein KC548_05545, partial [Nanoarchaeota archaeon]|nr:hypothetical protein [Nanoarchaeota archaeon]
NQGRDIISPKSFFVYECIDQIGSGGDLFCLEKVSNLGDNDFCENIVNANDYCEEGEYQCTSSSQCEGNLICDSGYCEQVPTYVTCYLDGDVDGYGDEEDSGTQYQDTCPNYTFEEEAYIHWPAAIAGVLAYSGTEEVNYIGHSNGGRTALFGLNAYSQGGLNNAGEILNFTSGAWEYVDLPSHPVSKFFGIGVPSTLNGETKFTNLVRNYGDVGLNAIKDKKHIQMYEYAYPMLTEESIFRFDNDPAKDVFEGILFWGLVNAITEPLSEKVMEFYHNLAYDNETEIDLSNVDVDKLYLFNGNPTDLIVPISDATIINNSASGMSANDKEIIPYDEWNHLENHVFITDNPLVKKDIRGLLENG